MEANYYNNFISYSSFPSYFENQMGWVEVTEAAKYPAVHRTVALTKIYPAQNLNSAEVEKHWPKENNMSPSQ